MPVNGWLGNRLLPGNLLQAKRIWISKSVHRTCRQPESLRMATTAGTIPLSFVKC